jgi:multidrug resistance efflux pump
MLAVRGALSVVTMTLFAVLAGCGRQADDLELPAELSELGARASAPTYPVERDDLAVEIDRVARVQSVRLQELYFQEGGRIAELNVGTGDQVTGGQILARIASGSIQHSLRLAEIDLEIDRSGWCHLRAEGHPSERAPLDVRYAQAFTNPIWITVGEQPIRDAAAAEYGMRWIDRLRAMADAWPGWRSDRERAHVFAQFDEARAIYERFAAEAP